MVNAKREAEHELAIYKLEKIFSLFMYLTTDRIETVERMDDRLREVIGGNGYFAESKLFEIEDVLRLKKMPPLEWVERDRGERITKKPLPVLGTWNGKGPTPKKK